MFSYSSAIRECRRMNQGNVSIGEYTITKRWYGWIVVLRDEYHEKVGFKPIKNNEDAPAIIEGFVLGALFMFLLYTLAIILHPLVEFV